MAAFVRLCVLPSLKVPVAVNCTLVPLAIDVLGELIVMACNVAAVTVSAKLFEVIPFWVAMMLLEPIAVPLAKPAVLTFTVTGLEEVHVAVLVRF